MIHDLLIFALGVAVCRLWLWSRWLMNCTIHISWSEGA